MSIAFNVNADDLQQLANLADQLAGLPGREELLRREGQVLQETVRHHFEGLAADTSHHKTAESLGGKETGFYQEAADRVQAPAIEGGDGVSVSVEHEGLAQRYFGGEIHGDPWLTIPARAEAYGRRAREFENLQLIILPSGAGALVAKPEGKVKLRGKRGGRARTVPAIDSKGSDVFYWLVRQVHQEPDPHCVAG